MELEFNDVIRGIFCSLKPGIYINGEVSLWFTLFCYVVYVLPYVTYMKFI